MHFDYFQKFFGIKGILFLKVFFTFAYFLKIKQWQKAKKSKKNRKA